MFLPGHSQLRHRTAKGQTWAKDIPGLLSVDAAVLHSLQVPVCTRQGMPWPSSGAQGEVQSVPMGVSPCRAAPAPAAGGGDLVGFCALLALQAWVLRIVTGDISGAGPCWSLSWAFVVFNSSQSPSL